MNAKEEKTLVQVLARINQLKESHAASSESAAENGSLEYAFHKALLASAYEYCYGLLIHALITLQEKQGG